MIRISKLTDYALVLLSEMTERSVLSATQLSLRTKIPLATTNKILKQLTHAGLCQSRSGKMGGFLLSKTQDKISILSVIQAIEGTPSLTQCGTQTCQLQEHCKITQKINLIDREIYAILEKRFLSDLI